MRVRVLYFGVLKERLGRDGEEMELAAGARVRDLLARFEGEWISGVAVAVNREYAKGEDVLKEGDEVAVLPPVSGGLGGRCRTAGPSTPPLRGSAQDDTSFAQDDTSFDGSILLLLRNG